MILVVVDECIGRPISDAMRGLVAFRSPTVNWKHLLELAPEDGTGDHQWIPRLRDTDCVVISRDRGSRQMRHRAKLPHLCRENRITHVLLSAGLGRRPQWEQAVAILAWLDQILSAHSRSRGDRLDLRLHLDRPTLVTSRPGRGR